MTDAIKIKIIMLLLLCVFVVPSSYALCSCEMTNDPIFEGESQSFLCSCSSPNERNQAYNISWYDESSNLLNTNLGTTPGNINTPFGESFIVPSGINLINATLTGTNLEGQDAAIVLAKVQGDLQIVNISSTQIPLIGHKGSMIFRVLDYQNKSVTNAHCSIAVSESVGGSPSTSVQNSITSYDGWASFSIDLETGAFDENTAYIVEISCSCVNNTEKYCFNENLDPLNFAVGRVSTIATTSAWLSSVNTLTDSLNYVLSDNLIYVCANVTNENDHREEIKINYNYRCGANNEDTDRVVIDSYEEIRGISPNTTQNQCAALKIYNVPSIQNKNNSCYAATDVCIIDEENKCHTTYSTTSPVFYLYSDTDTENEEYLNVRSESESMLPIILGFGLLAVLLFYIGYNMVKNENKSLKIEIALAGVQVISGAFIVLWGILWLLMDFAAGRSYYDVVKVFFTIYSIILGFVPLIVWLVSGLIVTFLFLGRFFRK